MPYKEKRKRKGPGKAHRKGITLIEFMDMFPDERAARKWLEGVRWAEGRFCGHCHSENTKTVSKEKPMPYWCNNCRRYFSIRSGTPMESSRIPLRKWIVAIYLMATNLKGVSSLKIHRDIGVTQKTAWFMIHRIRESWAEKAQRYAGPIEVDETYVGGKQRNRHAKERRKYTGFDDKAIVVGMKDRATNKIEARVVPVANAETLTRFVYDRVKRDIPGTKVYTDQNQAYWKVINRSAVNHSRGQYVDGDVSTNGIESFWAMLKRGYKGTYHYWSRKHLHRYVNEFAGRHNVRDLDTIDQMVAVADGFVGKRLTYEELIA